MNSINMKYMVAFLEVIEELGLDGINEFTAQYNHAFDKMIEFLQRKFQKYPFYNEHTYRKWVYTLISAYYDFLIIISEIEAEEDENENEHSPVSC